MISKALVSFITTWILSNTEFSEKLAHLNFSHFHKMRCQIRPVTLLTIAKLRPIT